MECSLLWPLMRTYGHICTIDKTDEAFIAIIEYSITDTKWTLHHPLPKPLPLFNSRLCWYISRNDRFMYRISSSLNKKGSASLAFNVRLSCEIRLDRILESRIVDMASQWLYVYRAVSTSSAIWSRTSRISRPLLVWSRRNTANSFDMIIRKQGLQKMDGDTYSPYWRPIVSSGGLIDVALAAHTHIITCLGRLRHVQWTVCWLSHCLSASDVDC